VLPSTEWQANELGGVAQREGRVNGGWSGVVFLPDPVRLVSGLRAIGAQKKRHARRHA
jgi:hypothetical protein